MFAEKYRILLHRIIQLRLGISGVAATAGEQIGYSIADVVAKAVFGILIWAIAAEKTKLEDEGSLLKNAA